MSLPEADLHRIQLWARERVPEDEWEKLRVEADVAARHVDIVEVRPNWPGGGLEPIRESVARLRYTQNTGLWAIYWCDRNSKFHVYKHKAPSTSVQSLLDYIEDSGDPIFWG